MAERLMAHLVAGFPTDHSALHAALGMVGGGASYLEVQFPFSDPSADGPAIQAACQIALDRGWRTNQGWDLVQELSRLTPVPVYVMAYASLVFAPGVHAFCRRAREANAAGLIVPDLPVGQDEGLAQAAREEGLDLLPVLVPSILPHRLEEVLKGGFRGVYAALRSGITGAHTELSPALMDFLQDLRTRGLRVFGGFGIHTREQVQTLSPHVHAVVVGSHLVRVIQALPQDSPPEAYAKACRAAVAALLGENHA